ncbi:hypothetical protein BI330_19755 [Mycobacterium sp. CBMA 623]|nr:hypothetical protein [Mycobacteroides sp. CBMA 326]
MAWVKTVEPKIKGEVYYTKMLTDDPVTGMSVQMVHYPAGTVNIWHCHHASHGMYVQEGEFYTNGMHGPKVYGPGSWVWFPAGGWMEHGATDNSDAVCLAVFNMPFDEYFMGDPNPPAEPFL